MKLRRDRHWKLSSSGFTATESLEIAAGRRHGCSSATVGR
ncbi:unnamed protein product [Brassica rapa subsp. narinosa]|uniref:(rape) hypothetical protein n=1 Tax=Brassica napus TaxID=3708 RepID=A0A816NVF4_BRANA|nr:unnamed protein product [Brassica napus]